jgi:hypothetical protein
MTLPHGFGGLTAAGRMRYHLGQVNEGRFIRSVLLEESSMQSRKLLLSLSLVLGLCLQSGCLNATIDGARQGVVDAYNTVVEGLIVSVYTLAIQEIVSPPEEETAEP